MTTDVQDLEEERTENEAKNRTEQNATAATTAKTAFR